MNAGPAPAALDALADEYEIVRELGRGGTAVVFLARERSTGDEVAIKLVRAQFADDEEATSRLAREAHFVTQLHHPNIVPVRAVLDLGDAGVALVMTHVPGRTLRQILRDEGAQPPERVERIVRDIAGALAAAHEMGIVHRDVKPENVFVGDDDRVVLADFGIARSMSPEAQQLTMHGVAIGTPAYMAPEQIDGNDLDARADLYALGLLGWEMLTGRRPFAGEALYSVLYHQKHVQLDDPRAQRTDVPAALLSALAGAVEKERDARWSNADAFLGALDGAVEPREWPVSTPAGSATVRIERTRPVPEDSVVAIDWREVMEPAPPAPAWRLPARRRVAFGSAVGAFVALALVVSAVRVHSRDSAYDQQRVASDGQVAINDAPKPVPLAAEAPAVVAGRTATVPADSAPAPATKPTTLALVAPTPAPAVTTPPAAPAATAVRAAVGGTVRVTVGGRHSCLLGSDGEAWCWGGNDRGQLGTDTDARLAAPFAPVSGEHFTLLASGMSHSCGLAPTGEAWCWGDNDSGQLGDGSTTSHAAPTRVATERSFRSLVAGSAFTCALAPDASAFCWGTDANGELGDRGTGTQPSPVRVAGNHRFTSLAAGWSFACAIDTASNGWCWGSNGSGQLGDSATANERTPVRVRGELTFAAIAAGSAHACGVTNDGSVWCWGSNSSGQLGTTETRGSSIPIRVHTALRFTSITAGAVHSCALTADGAAWCWGSNVYGQLGDGSNTDSAVPVRVLGGHSFTALRSFGSHNCGVTSAGETFCWGYNLDGQLGDGTRTHRSRPVYVQRPGTP